MTETQKKALLNEVREGPQDRGGQVMAEALDMAAQVAGWLNWKNACHLAECGEIDVIRAHAKTLMENAALEAKLADVSKALMATAEAAASSAKKAVEAEAKLAVAREALGSLSLVELAAEESILRDNDIVVLSFKTFSALRAALKEIDHGDR